MTFDNFRRIITELGQERSARLALTALAEPGNTLVGRLVAEYGAPQTLHLGIGIGVDDDALEHPDEIDRFRRLIAPRASDATIIRMTELVERADATLLIPGDAHWPAGLDVLGDAQPLALWARGNTGILAQPVERRVALTGARAATGYGEHVATELATGLAEHGVAVVSGGAYGIDAAAHRATLTAGGTTVAVLASGIDQLYPAGNASLLRRIGESGLLLSELLPGTAPTRDRFLQRGRIIAALSEATVVVEAGYRSGSLLVAAQARALGRTVAAVPGPVTSAASSGTHRLLREHNARLVTDIHDLRSLLPD